MRKILVTLVLLSAALFPRVVFADGVTAGGLMAYGMPGPLADYLVNNGISITPLLNNTYLSAANASGTPAALNLLKADASDNTVLNAKTGKVINLDVAGTPVVGVNSLGFTSTANTLVVTAPTAIAISAGAATTPVASWKSDGVSFSAAGSQPYFPAAAVITPSTSFPTPAAGDTLTQRFTILAAGAPTAAFVELPRATANVGKTFSLFNQGSNPGAIVPVSGDTQGVAAAATPFSCTTLKSCDCTALTTSNWQCGVR